MVPVRSRPVPTPKVSSIIRSSQLSKRAKGIRTPTAITVPGIA